MPNRTITPGLCAAIVLTLSVFASAGERRETPLVRAVKRAQTSVVNIHSEKTSYDQSGGYNSGPGRKINGMGTGIVIDERGYIVTNQHVIAEVDSLRVTLIDGSTYQAQVVSYDRKHDLAVIKVNPTKPLTVMPAGTSSDLMLGETVIAVGNAFGYEHTVTSGIISALSRDVEVNEKQGYKNLIQTDASINPGNSGGPLLNLDGEVVGINVAIRAGAQRIGFAIPIDDARVLVAKLLNVRRLNETYHGIVGRDIKTHDIMQMVVAGAEPDSPAARAGLQSGDIVLAVDDVKVLDQADLERAFLSKKAGEVSEIVVKRDDQETRLKLELAKNTPGSGAAPTNEVALAMPTPSTESLEDRTWSILGFRLSKVPEVQLQQFQTRYRGGMQVLEVRADSPAARNGIKQGDILVGLHVWETVNLDNVSYVLNHPQFVTFNPVKFYVIRGRQTLYGHLQLPQLTP